MVCRNGGRIDTGLPLGKGCVVAGGVVHNADVTRIRVSGGKRGETFDGVTERA
jgi:hypothetical protein